MVEGANSRLKAALLCFMRLSPLTSHSCSRIWQSCCSGTCKPAPRFRHPVTTRTGREFLLQFIITRVSQSCMLSGTVGEAATAPAGLGILRNGTDCIAKSNLWFFVTQCNMYIVLEIYIHTHIYIHAQLHTMHMYGCMYSHTMVVLNFQ